MLHGETYNRPIGIQMYLMPHPLYGLMKLVVVVREDLNLSPGKMAAQAGHAAVSVSWNAQKKNKKWVIEWLSKGQKKVILKAKDLELLKSLAKKAEELKLPYEIIKDAGETEVEPGTITCIGILGPERIVNKITGSLPLF